MFSFSLDSISFYNLCALILGFLYGYISQQTQFCFSGSVKDIVLFKHTKRLASIIMAMISAIFFTTLGSIVFNIDLTQTIYYTNANYLFIIIGGLLFGYGMMLSDGCSSRHLIKFAQGDKYSLLSLISISISAFIAYVLFDLFHDSIISNGFTILTNADNIFTIPAFGMITILIVVLYFTLEKNFQNITSTFDGFLIGILIAISWYVTTALANEHFIYIKDQSFSFIYPLQKFSEYIGSFFTSSLFVYPVYLILGVLLGSFVSSKLNKKFKTTLSCHDSSTKFQTIKEKIIGGLCMGVGGYLTIGCTVGQGLSGVSTLACTSVLAIVSIMVSAYFTALHLKEKNRLIACFVFEFEKK